MAKKLLAPKNQLRVVLLSGFLGSGKTTLVKRILTSTAESNANLRIAVIVNEITAENLDYVNIQGSKLVNVGSESVVEMSNGCICCTLRLDLMRQLYELWGTQRYDAVVIESSGVSDPSEVAESFFVPVPMSDLEPEASHDPASTIVMQTITPLVNCVTVVDASTIDEFIASDGSVGEVHPDLSPEDGGNTERSISELLFLQMEFASAIVFNKVDLLSPAPPLAAGSKRGREDAAPVAEPCTDTPKARSLCALAKKINPVALVHLTVQCQVPVGSMLRLDATTPKELHKYAKTMIETISERSSGVFVADVEKGQLRVAEGAVMPDHVPETEEFQISSHVFRSDRPFHPRRLYDWMTSYFVLVQLVSESQEEGEEDGADAGDVTAKMTASCPSGACPPDTAPARKERYGNLFRGKGYCWVGDPERAHLFGSWSQAGSTLNLFCGGHWDEDFPWDHPTLKQQASGGKGRRSVRREPHQILSFVGQRMKWEVLDADLRGLLLTDEELAVFEKQMLVEEEAVPLEAWLMDVPFAPWEADGGDEEDEEGSEEEVAEGDTVRG